MAQGRRLACIFVAIVLLACHAGAIQTRLRDFLIDTQTKEQFLSLSGVLGLESPLPGLSQACVLGSYESRVQFPRSQFESAVNAYLSDKGFRGGSGSWVIVWQADEGPMAYEEIDQITVPFISENGGRSHLPLQFKENAANCGNLENLFFIRLKDHDGHLHIGLIQIINNSRKQ